MRTALRDFIEIVAVFAFVILILRLMEWFVVSASLNICFTKAWWLGQASRVRRFVVFCLAIFSPWAAWAQNQERSLVDRLLKPDTTLKNSAQSKKFIADGAPITRRAAVSTFYIQQKAKPRSFVGAREFSSAGFNSRSFPNGNQISPSAQQQAHDSSESYSTSSVTELRNAPDSQKKQASRTFAGQRPFLERGKSQKSLDRQNPPLTIEQVRELLNKNK